MKSANKAKRLIVEQKMAVLSTNSKRYGGFPFGSVVGYAIDLESRPLILMSALAVHHRNLEADPRASLTIFEDEAMDNPTKGARVTVMGEVRRVPATDLAEARTTYLAKHPEAAQWIDFGDFSMLRMEVKDLYFIGEFGSMGWIIPEDYRAAGHGDASQRP
jgi:putative heme iron utilization protein